MTSKWLDISFPFTSLPILKPAPKPGFVPVSVNWFPHRVCNYRCDFCFHTSTNDYILPLDEGKRALRLLADAGMKKLNISGGEPFLQPAYLGEVFKFCKEELHIESCSVVCNGSKVTEKWLDTYGEYLDLIAISCDSFDVETNLKQGRAENGTSTTHINKVFKVAQWSKARGIKVKINTVVTINNWEEDMNDQIQEIDPVRWKVFQVLLLDSENTGPGSNSLRDARHLTVIGEQYQAFLDRHAQQPSLVPEDNNAMKDSYLLLDEKMRFLDCSNSGKKPGRSILDVGVETALLDSGFDEKTFLERGGIFEWTREPEPESVDW
ncbi:radical SAM enzyme [Boletus edulis BED1]|uniref:Radical SAM enzyme n=1 Tax=Boletus edulis BED1 TaxID=1328754 RepID=A0AAD4GC34_BOLED|nr:radical SAM enzyme [Boletus edulis BED1]